MAESRHVKITISNVISMIWKKRVDKHRHGGILGDVREVGSSILVSSVQVSRAASNWCCYFLTLLPPLHLPFPWPPSPSTFFVFGAQHPCSDLFAKSCDTHETRIHHGPCVITSPKQPPLASAHRSDRFCPATSCTLARCSRTQP